MRTIAIGLLAMFIAAAALVPQAHAQAPAAQPAAGQAATPPTVLFASAADVAALIAKAKAERKDQANIPQSIVRLAPYTANVEYRASVGNATVHVHEAELFYVMDGSATMVTGGKLVGQTAAAANAENLAGSAIEGGVTRTIAKGDFIMVPENTPHWFSTINQTLIVMSIHVPRPTPPLSR